MREHYDFSKMKGKKNPYTKHLKQPVTMRLDKDSISYFKGAYYYYLRVSSQLAHCLPFANCL